MHFSAYLMIRWSTPSQESSTGGSSVCWRWPSSARATRAWLRMPCLELHVALFLVFGQALGLPAREADAALAGAARRCAVEPDLELPGLQLGAVAREANLDLSGAQASH